VPDDAVVVAHTLEAERAVLGAVIANDERLTDVLDVVTPADFFRDAHRRVFQTMLALSEESTPIDPVTLTERLKRDGALEGVGGPAYVASLADGVPRSTNARSYAEAVCDAARIRRLEQAANKILALARERQDDAQTLISRAEQIIFGLSQHRGKSDVLDGQALAARAYQLVDLLLDTKQHVSGTASGYHDFDVMTRGLQPGTLVLIAARLRWQKRVSRSTSRGTRHRNSGTR